MFTVLDELLRDCSSVSVKRSDNGVFRAWGVGIGEFSGFVVYGDGATVELSFANLKESIQKKRWRRDRFSRAF